MAALSPNDLYTLTVRHFGDLGQDVVNLMYQIALRESGGDPNAKNLTGPDRSYGLWQINTIAGANPDMLKYNLTDPEQNAAAAREIYDRAGPTAWSTYGSASGGGGGVNNNSVDYSDPKQRQRVLSGVVDALKASQPKKEDFTDPAYTDKFGNHPEVFDANGFNQAMADWGNQMADALKQFQDASSEAAGVFQLGDGTIITQAQMDQLDPSTRAQVQAQIANQNTDRLNSFNTLMNNLGLTEFTTTQNSAISENQRTSNDFQNQLEHYREQLGLDQANQDTVVKQIDRQIKGMDISNTRSSTTLDALLKAAPWGTTGGKTSFSPADLGGAISKIAQFGGIGANTPLLNFTGTQNIDPNAMFQAYDQQLGVQGQLPQVPNLTTTPGMIPTPPASIPIQQGAPSFAPYIPPTPVPLPQASPPSGNALSPAANKLLHGIFSSLRGQ